MTQLQVTNEESLKHLSAYLESVQNQQWPSTLPNFISFYVREKNAKGKFWVCGWQSWFDESSTCENIFITSVFIRCQKQIHSK